nr:PREDICTED: uncharacterized protein LOC105663389 [Megachile rotundata]
MSRVQLEQLNIEGLRELARQQILDIRGVRAVLFERLIDHFEAIGWPEQIIIPGPSETESQSATEGNTLPLQKDLRTHGNVNIRSDDTGTSRYGQKNTRIDNSRVPNLQEIVQTVLQALGPASMQPSNQQIMNAASPSPSAGSQSSALQNWNQVKFTVKLIPPFSGQEEDKVITWLERIGNIGRIYQLSDEVLVLAAVNQLQGRALSWYNRQPIETISSWEDFKFHVRAYFERKESVTVTLSRVGSRTWRMYSEKFADYAEDKLKLMQSLTLTEKEKIELLADGIKDPSLRRFALDTWATTVPEFINHIRKITEDNVAQRPETSKKSLPVVRPSSNRKICAHCKKSGHEIQECRIAKVICYNCGQTGHLSTGCPKKRSGAGPSLNHVAESSLEDTVEAATGSSSIAVVTRSFNLQGKETPFITVYSLGKADKSFCTLVDTGSPVNLVKRSVYTVFLQNNKLLRVRDNLNLKGVNNSVISVYGKIHDQIQLEKLKGQWFDITLLVVDDNTIVFDMLLGREFFMESRIKIIYENGEFIFESPFNNKENTNTILVIEAVNQRDQYDIAYENLDKDLDFSSKTRLIELLREIDSAEIEPVKDNYRIRVHLKDQTLFRYAPRRMSVQEKAELREITDNLLARGIIKPSISPYCSRIVLVTKRNGSKQISFSAYRGPNRSTRWEKNFFKIGSKRWIPPDRNSPRGYEVFFVCDAIWTIRILREVLTMLRSYNLELNMSKCLFLKKEIEFLGYVISEKGVTLNQRHTEAISAFPYPTNLRQVQGFVGLSGYFRKFIHNYTLKTELTSFPTLRIYNPKAETELHTDASCQGFGAILLQRQDSKDLAPIAYFSKATTDTEKKYHSFELETLAIIKALERFHVYLQEKDLFVVPENMINQVIQLYHDEMGHVGIEKTMYGITDHYWFPNLKLKIRQYIDNCVQCLSYSLAAGKAEGEMQIYEKDTIPFQTIHIDHFGPLEETTEKFKYILVIVDACTKFVWLFPTKSTGANEVINSLTLLFHLLGYPNRIISDRGSAFSSHNFSEFLKDKEISHTMTAVASPWANGQVERVNRFLKSTLAKITEQPRQWKDCLGLVQYVINNTFHKAINSTPSKHLFGFDQWRVKDEHLWSLIDAWQALDRNYVEVRTNTRMAAQEVNRKLQEYNKEQYDKRHKKITPYSVGDLVLLKKLQNQPGINTKLTAKFKGPYQIKAILKKNRFVVTDIPGYNLTQKPYNTILSADKIKPWIRVKDSVSENNVNTANIEMETDSDSDLSQKCK